MGSISSTQIEAHKESILAFDRAIANGRLTTNPLKSNYAGNYMFMGNKKCRISDWKYKNKDLFKNIDTRKYDV